VSQQLVTVYEEFLNGDLPTTRNQPGEPVIQGTNVEIQIHTTNPSEYDSTEAAAVSLGMQVTMTDPGYDVMVGFVPIAQLPAIGAIAGAPSISPITYPQLH
jgi:hypothetical protein